VHEHINADSETPEAAKAELDPRRGRPSHPEPQSADEETAWIYLTTILAARVDSAGRLGKDGVEHARVHREFSHVHGRLCVRRSLNLHMNSIAVLSVGRKVP
jgi:hypothetical protein